MREIPPDKRKPIEKFDRTHAVWSTQFNDLRRPDTIQVLASDHAANRMRELKVMALFQPGTIIRDADVVNDTALLKLISEDRDGIANTIRNGPFVLCLRDDAESFAEVNERAGRRRAFPSRYETNTPLVRHLDEIVSNPENPCVVASSRVTHGDDRFVCNLTRVLLSGIVPNEDAAAIRGAVAYARQESDGRVRFGDVFRFLTERAHTWTGGAIQACRAAHVLVGATEAELPVSIADSDIAPATADSILGPREGGTSIDQEVHGELLPRRILLDSALDRLDFHKLWEIRVKYAPAYFAAYAHAMSLMYSGIEDTAFRGAYADYLVALQGYLENIGEDAGVDLVDWQERIRTEALQESQVSQRWQMVEGIPILVSVTLSLFTQNLGFLSLQSALSSLRERTWTRRERRTHPLEKLVAGVTVRQDDA